MECEIMVTSTLALFVPDGSEYATQVKTGISLELSPNLPESNFYNKNGEVNEQGNRIILDTLVNGIITQVHYADEVGIAKGHVLIAEVIEKLGKMFAEVYDLEIKKPQ